MDLDDEKIKKLISSFLIICNKDKPLQDKSRIIMEFKKETEIYIYNFPRLVYKKGQDTCSDFYLFVLERLESIIKNFPMEDELKFKTWFNYVLKNQFLNFMAYQKKNSVIELQIDNYENELSVELFEHEETEMAELKQGLDNLDLIDRVLIKFYYMPELIDTADIRAASDYFRLSVETILEIQKNLITANLKAVEQIRELSSGIRKINKALLDLKYKLYREKEYGSDLVLKEKNEILLKIARQDASKYKYLRRLEIPNKAVFQEFMLLFSNIYQAKNRLSIARKKLKFEVLKLLKTKKAGVTYE